MSVALPTFGTRIAPTFIHCDQVLLVRVVAGQIVRLGTVRATGLTEDERIKLLEENHTTVLVCGGIDIELRCEIAARGIEVIDNVAGEVDDVLESMAGGQFAPGYGINYHPGQALHRPGETDCEPDNESPVEEPLLIVDCMACEDRLCMRGLPCHRTAELTPHQVPEGSNLRRLMDAAMDIAAEPERVLCRIAEIVYFTLEMEYKRLGLAFCTDLFTEAETVARVLERFFEVVPVCCKIGGLVPDQQQEVHSQAVVCNAAPMAHALNQAATNLNITLGLSIGADVIFNQLSMAPVTTLVVKDRLLANNPVSAVHSRYVLEHVLGRT